MSSTAPRLAQRFRPRPRGGGPRPGPSLARAGGDPRAADGRSLVAPVLAATSAGRSQTLSAPSTSARRRSDLVVSEYSAEPITAARSRRRSVARFLTKEGSYVRYVADRSHPEVIRRHGRREFFQIAPGG